MDKRRLHHYWTKIRPISYWYLLAISVVMLVVFVLAYRQNNLTALELRNAVVEADKNNGDIEAALRELRQFTYAHMNAGLGTETGGPPIQLKYRYDRLMEAEEKRVAAAKESLYNEAQNYCEKQIPGGLSGRGRVPCVEEYVSQRSISTQAIPVELYQYDFVSPQWSPDLAGFSLVLAVFFFVLFLGRFMIERWFIKRLDI